LTGAEGGLHAGRSRRTCWSLTAWRSNNAACGFYLESDVTDAVLRNNQAYGTAGNADTDQNNGFYLRGDRMTVVGQHGLQDRRALGHRDPG